MTRWPPSSRRIGPRRWLNALCLLLLPADMGASARPRWPGFLHRLAAQWCPLARSRFPVGALLPLQALDKAVVRASSTLACLSAEFAIGHSTSG